MRPRQRRKDRDGPAAIAARQPAPSRYRVADVHRQRPGPCRGAVQGRHRRLVPGAQRAPGRAARHLAHRLQAELAAFQAAHPDKKVGPIAVNQIVHPVNDRLQHDVEVCVKHKIPIIISSLRAPPRMLDASTAMAASCCTT